METRVLGFFDPWMAAPFCHVYVEFLKHGFAQRYVDRMHADFLGGMDRVETYFYKDIDTKGRMAAIQWEPCGNREIKFRAVVFDPIRKVVLLSDSFGGEVPIGIKITGDESVQITFTDFEGDWTRDYFVFEDPSLVY